MEKRETVDNELCLWRYIHVKYDIKPAVVSLPVTQMTDFVWTVDADRKDGRRQK